MKINDVIRGKSTSGVITIKQEASVRDLLALLAKHNIGAVVVSADGSKVDGIVSERDVVRKLNGNDAVLDATVEEIMTAVVPSMLPTPAGTPASASAATTSDLDRAPVHP